MTTKTVYFAGALFDQKHLTGNALLAEAINKLSAGRYLCILPQDLELPANRAEDIRNQDLKQVLDCDVALFNFDGAELDSGTVVEFMYAKFLDKPSVILRSDFRSGGDQEEGEPWNLMCSFYPRTESLLLNAMADYHQAMSGEGSIAERLNKYHEEMALKVIEAFDKSCAQDSVMAEAGVDPQQIQHWATSFAGKGFQALCNDKASKPIE